ASLPDQGITSYKLFMAYKGALMVDDETLYRAMEVAAKSGALVMVHAENGDVVDLLVREALAAGHTEPLYHALTRPPEAEGEATNRAIQLAHLAGAHRCAVGDLHRPLRVPVGRPEDTGQGRLLEDPERRPGPRGPAEDDPPLRRQRGADHAEPDGRAARDEPGEAVRALPAQGHGR